MDLMNTSLAGLAAIGAVNVITMFKPEIDSKVKFILSLVIAFLVLFIPTDLSNMFLDKLRIALEVAFAASGVYKLSQKIGSN